MSVIRLFNYQLEAYKEVQEGNSVVCNWSRAGGKTFFLAYILLKIRPANVLIDYSYRVGVNEIHEKLQEIFHVNPEYTEVVKKYYHHNKTIEMVFDNGQMVTITNDPTHLRGEIDFTFYDNTIPIDNEVNRKFIAMVTRNNSSGHLQKKFGCKIIEADIFDLVESGFYDMDFIKDKISSPRFLDEYAIKNPKQDEKISPYDFKQQALQKLQKQFLNTRDTKDTVLTRKNIIEMIVQLNKM